MAILEGPVFWASLSVPNKTFDPATYQATLVVDQKTADEFEGKGFKIKEIRCHQHRHRAYQTRQSAHCCTLQDPKLGLLVAPTN